MVFTEPNEKLHASEAATAAAMQELEQYKRLFTQAELHITVEASLHAAWLRLVEDIKVMPFTEDDTKMILRELIHRIMQPHLATIEALQREKALILAERATES